MTTEIASLQARKADGIGWMVFNDPARHNAISMDMAREVPRVMADFEADPEVRVVIVTGMGERAFAAGSNISAFGSVRTNPEQNREYNQINQRSYDAVYACAKPTIAMVHGYCIGGGLDFAVSCDIRVCADSAVFAIPAVRLGLGFGHEGQVRVARVMGAAAARDLFFTGRRYSAQEALACQLVHRVVPAAELEPSVLDYARQIAGNAPLTLRALKRAFLEYEKPESARDLAAAQALVDACYASEDYQEGRAAFADKRTPNFKGR
ncbi:enoyl-CoA hydratase [Variovorax sp. KK3]|uniref:enoyl-CoA hydratase n=1 Tax=Variovorax sp. KK3 TaxID=1855728 RepID=UPI00097C1655|nr:enoyl-CoA hydratase [Variovorax sp. KK3]